MNEPRGGVVLQPAERRWWCPNCDATHVTRRGDVHTAFHSCRGLYGLTTPFVPDGVKAKVEAVERQDWVGRELVQLDGRGRPVMAAVTTRDDGTDCTVYAPCATARLGG